VLLLVERKVFACLELECAANEATVKSVNDQHLKAAYERM